MSRSAGGAGHPKVAKPQVEGAQAADPDMDERLSALTQDAKAHPRGIIGRKELSRDSSTARGGALLGSTIGGALSAVRVQCNYLGV